MNAPVISDTGPIIHLAEAHRLSLLGVFESLHVPATVRDELSDGTVPDGFDELPVVVHECEAAGYPTLDPGESAALNLCSELDGILLTDDLEARRSRRRTTSKSMVRLASSCWLIPGTN